VISIADGYHDMPTLIVVEDTAGPFQHYLDVVVCYHSWNEVPTYVGGPEEQIVKGIQSLFSCVCVVSLQSFVEGCHECVLGT
jgi:hypothetical protein